jgi:short subunit dehydrogenase-like uncharacterized protein
MKSQWMIYGANGYSTQLAIEKAVEQGENASGKVVTAGIEVPDGYTVTMDGIIMTADYCRGYQGEAGCYTPSQLMGQTLAEQLPGAGSFSSSITQRS